MFITILAAFIQKNEMRDDFWFFSEKEKAVHDTIMQSVRENNPFYLTLKAHLESTANAPQFRLLISDIPPPNAATRTYNRPTSKEVAVIIMGAEGDAAAASSRVVILEKRGGGVQRISSSTPLMILLLLLHTFSLIRGGHMTAYQK